jgi:hypothetical protein
VSYVRVLTGFFYGLAIECKRVQAVLGLQSSSTTGRCLGALSTQCSCGAGEETPRHVALFCVHEAERRQGLRTSGRVNFQQLVGTNGGAKRVGAVDDPIREIRPFLTSQKPSLQLNR